MTQFKQLFFIMALVFVAAAASAQVKVGSNPTVLAPNAYLQVEGPSGVQTVVLDNGNVGVGTLTPAVKLHVKGIGNTDATSSLTIQNSADRSLLTVVDDGTLITGGNIEINETGSGNRPGVIDLHAVDGVDYSARLLRAGGPNGGLFLRNQGTGSITIDAENVSGAEVVVNGTTGNVGLGVTAPTQKLDVVGNIIARGSATIANQPGTILTWNNAALGLLGKSGIVNNSGTGEGGFVFAITNDGITINTLLDLNNTVLNSGMIQNQKGYFKVAAGTTAERPAGSVLVAGMIRFNTTTSKFEGYDGTNWVDLN